MNKNPKVIVDPTLEQRVAELNELIRYRQFRPLVRFDKHFWLVALIILEFALQFYIIYLLKA